MSKVLFLSIPAHGHVNPTLGLVNELVKQGEDITYFCSQDFKEKIEKTGAEFKAYETKANILERNHNMPNSMDISKLFDHINEMLKSSDEIIESILNQIKDEKFDYIMYAAMFPFGNIIAQILKIPSISSFAVFATPKELMAQNKQLMNEDLIKKHPVIDTYKKVSKQLKETYNVEIPESMIELFFNKGDINIAYTSKYFVAHTEYYDGSFKFIGPPIYDRKEDLNFPFEKLDGKKVVYISLGTVFNNTSDKLYNIFFKTFANSDAVVVMAAYNVDLSKFDIPENFIVRNYVPQSEILKYTDVAITHAGMNSTSDLLYNNVPFVAIPIGADQPYMAGRASELGAAISLDKDTITSDILKSSVKSVLNNPAYLENIKKISNSFKQSGGYKEAVKEIFKLKREKGILV
ncbi:glycosyltransferase, MGT family [Clostridium pasteurianum DSM 525 = ATCC 6013]|uniref:Glycosyltransferase, MGT family n=1 Tax=Clostridium pasteurianum DSM 525 = ATCC 6013 TaxID=1262449 RepID=A0A0H3JB00_CLOPA|nr:macrolide family glycosyltransferase [Clostridium pasteurianum]AJA50033.1 glycosyltransferase, MGT family [Clostridium pasteurianum DSM 525 = ATCC 6013]AJA54021.1 glycosyltransferase, MGT family [Clostridium pasteurianum DSM 525 = ATCC 6013]AOZ77161.1 glycosyl transferase [Clostridium pasteurianum DSM 525 = ATCC 6013]AOZ80958.1 glycosyl transferase [Clostridium pasteurianum]ELP59260.1 glycosyl transferase family protein [Clostridium pasteurianum DSM 525 = ATCC 6013]